MADSHRFSTDPRRNFWAPRPTSSSPTKGIKTNEKKYTQCSCKSRRQRVKVTHMKYLLTRTTRTHKCERGHEQFIGLIRKKRMIKRRILHTYISCQNAPYPSSVFRGAKSHPCPFLCGEKEREREMERKETRLLVMRESYFTSQAEVQMR